jgi:hypothetical protein
VIPGHRVLPELLVLPGRKDLLAIQELLDHKVHRVYKEYREIPGQLEPPDRRALLAILVRRALRA